MERIIRRNALTKDLCLAVALCLSVSAVLFSSSVEARLMAVDMAPLTETAHTAIHLPTGCIAQVTLDERTFISASITDPDCLPKGITAQPVPGSRQDFRLVNLSLSK